MQLILFSIRQQWISNLLQKPFNENSLASKLLMLLIYRLKTKNLHILQCDGDLNMWYVEGVSLRLPSLH